MKKSKAEAWAVVVGGNQRSARFHKEDAEEERATYLLGAKVVHLVEHNPNLERELRSLRRVLKVVNEGANGRNGDQHLYDVFQAARAHEKRMKR